MNKISMSVENERMIKAERKTDKERDKERQTREDRDSKGQTKETDGKTETRMGRQMGRWEDMGRKTGQKGI